jgi:hypothetical protein
VRERGQPTQVIPRAGRAVRVRVHSGGSLDASAPCFRGWTPLMWSAHYGSAVRARLRSAAATSAAVSTDRRAGAVTRAQEAVKFLLTKGADATAVAPSGETSLQLAEQQSHFEVAAVLSGWTGGLGPAVEYGNIPVIEWLLSAKPDTVARCSLAHPPARATRTPQRSLSARSRCSFRLSTAGWPLAERQQSDRGEPHGPHAAHHGCQEQRHPPGPCLHVFLPARARRTADSRPCVPSGR